MKKRSVLREKALVFVQKGVLDDVNWGVKACILRDKSINIRLQLINENEDKSKFVQTY